MTKEYNNHSLQIIDREIKTLTIGKDIFGRGASYKKKAENDLGIFLYNVASTYLPEEEREQFIREEVKKFSEKLELEIPRVLSIVNNTLFKAPIKTNFAKLIIASGAAIALLALSNPVVLIGGAIAFLAAFFQFFGNTITAPIAYDARILAATEGTLNAQKKLVLQKVREKLQKRVAQGSDDVPDAQSIVPMEIPTEVSIEAPKTQSIILPHRRQLGVLGQENEGSNGIENILSKDGSFSGSFRTQGSLFSCCGDGQEIGRRVCSI